MELASALATASATFELLKVAVNARDDAKVRAAVGEMASKLSEAYISGLASVERQHALAARVRELEDKCRVLEAQAMERESLTEAEVRPGVYAYARKPAQEGEQPNPPYFCQPCYDTGIKAVLRAETLAFHGKQLVCPNNERHTLSLE